MDKAVRNKLIYIPKYLKVLTKADEGGTSNLVPMVLWKAQKHYIENKTHRNIILKPRQIGLSTAELADNSHTLFTEHYERQTVITHDNETSEFLLQTVHRFHRNLPKDMRPQADWKSRSHLRLPKMDSYIYIDSAKSDSIGIGHGLTRVHCSEIARWPQRRADELYSDITNTVPAGGYITFESTAKGRVGLFYKLYTAAKEGEINYRAFFYPWWWVSDYQKKVKGKLDFTKEEQQLINSVLQREGIEITQEQIAWRREKIAELGDYFYQDFPENDVDCWLSSEMSVFDGVALRSYLQQSWPGKQEGNLTIWKDVIGGEKYLIGVDPAGGHEKGDFSVAAVLRQKTNEYVARLRGRIPPDMFTEELLRLGKRYNWATIGVERLMHGHTVLRILMENNYPEIYHHQDYDIYEQGVTSQPGWKTSGKTKPIMVDTLAAALRAGDIQIWSENFCNEASGYIQEGQKMMKQAGGYDDELDAVMIALMMREQSPILDQKREGPVSYATI